LKLFGGALSNRPFPLGKGDIFSFLPWDSLIIEKLCDSFNRCIFPFCASSSSAGKKAFWQLALFWEEVKAMEKRQKSSSNETAKYRLLEVFFSWFLWIQRQKTAKKFFLNLL